MMWDTLLTVCMFMLLITGYIVGRCHQIVIQNEKSEADANNEYFKRNHR